MNIPALIVFNIVWYEFLWRILTRYLTGTAFNMYYTTLESEKFPLSITLTERLIYITFISQRNLLFVQFFSVRQSPKARYRQLDFSIRKKNTKKYPSHRERLP